MNIPDFTIALRLMKRSEYMFLEIGIDGDFERRRVVHEDLRV